MTLCVNVMPILKEFLAGLRAAAAEEAGFRKYPV